LEKHPDVSVCHITKSFKRWHTGHIDLAPGFAGALSEESHMGLNASDSGAGPRFRNGERFDRFRMTGGSPGHRDTVDIIPGRFQDPVRPYLEVTVQIASKGTGQGRPDPEVEEYPNMTGETGAVPDELEAVARTGHQSQHNEATAEVIGRLNPSARRLISQVQSESNWQKIIEASNECKGNPTRIGE
jgi:hypothetical protein